MQHGTVELMENPGEGHEERCAETFLHSGSARKRARTHSAPVLSGSVQGSVGNTLPGAGGDPRDGRTLCVDNIGPWRKGRSSKGISKASGRLQIKVRESSAYACQMWRYTTASVTAPGRRRDRQKRQAFSCGKVSKQARQNNSCSKQNSEFARPVVPSCSSRSRSALYSPRTPARFEELRGEGDATLDELVSDPLTPSVHGGGMGRRNWEKYEWDGR
ncbi:hypothetical protein BD414DRAFT_509921 [Trametes punicea]|nr:hypothetical protein BD414DRAFT_509921 [Trametes punicea]